ncbi:MAG: MetQ/NlpA family ABC transporter substrate-binding protein [Victivallaceae bacterium]
MNRNLSVFILLLCFLCSGCRNKSKLSENITEISIVATPTPHALILKRIKPKLEKEGVFLKIIEVDDYKIPNRLVADKQVDANFFQHILYFENECRELKYSELAILTPVHIEPMGIYSKKNKSLQDFRNDSCPLTIAVPIDVTNEKRALDLLSSLSLIRFKEEKDSLNTATARDVYGNERKITLVEVPAPMLIRSLNDVDLAVIPGNFALASGLNPKRDALFIESIDSLKYVNIVVVRSEDSEKPEFVLLKKYLSDSEIRDFIENEFQGAIEISNFTSS